jgi:hypothetical protein
VSKLKAIIDSAKRAGIDKSQPPRQMPDEAARQGIRGYHGSPYNFPPVRELEMPDGAVVYQSMDDAVPEGARVIKEHPLGRFDMSKIGTGEGAQAYSRGLYFAEREATGQSYRDTLSRDNLAQRAKDNQSYDTLVGLGLDESPELGTFSIILSEADGDMARAIQDSMTPRYPDDPLPAFAQSMADAMKSGRLPASIELPTLNKGSMYEVNIAATPDEFIDWDLPLDEQSESVMNALNKTDWYKYAEEGAYEAAGNRGDNPYGMDLVRWLEEDGAEDAVQMLKDAGIKGVQYADAQTRFGKGPKTKNYVVYDDKLIDIIKKYGVSVPIAAYIAEGIITPEEAQAVGFGSVVKKSLSDKTDEIQQGIGSLPAGDEMVTGGDLQFLMNKLVREQSVKQAKEQGYDLDNVMYHASKQDIEEFVPGYSDGLVFLTPSKEFANNWLGKGKFQERQGGTGSIEGVRAEKKRFMEEANNVLKSLPKDQRQQYFEEILNPQQQQLIKDELLADSAIYPVVTRTKKPFVPSKDVDVLEELYGKEYLDAPFGSGFPTYRDALKDGNYGLYEKKEVVDFLKSKGYDSMFLKESGGADKPFTTLAVFDPNNIRSVNAKFDPEKKDSPQILASAPFATGITGLGAMAALPSEEAQAGVISTLGELAKRADAGDEVAADALAGFTDYAFKVDGAPVSGQQWAYRIGVSDDQGDLIKKAVYDARGDMVKAIDNLDRMENAGMVREPGLSRRFAEGVASGKYSDLLTSRVTSIGKGAGISGLGAMAVLPPEEAQAGPLSAAGRAAQKGFTKDVYHGTTQDFDQVDPDAVDLGIHVGTPAQAANRLRDTTGNRFSGSYDEGANIMPLKARMNNTLEMEDAGDWKDSYQVLGSLRNTPVGRKNRAKIQEMEEQADEIMGQYAYGDEEWRDSPENRELLDEINTMLADSGYDSIRYKNQVENTYGSSAGLTPQAEQRKAAISKEINALDRKLYARKPDMPAMDDPDLAAKMDAFLSFDANKERTPADAARRQQLLDENMAISADPANQADTNSYIILDPDANLRSRNAQFMDERGNLLASVGTGLGLGVGAAFAPEKAQASEYPSLGGKGVTSAATPDEVAFKAPREPRRIPPKQPPGIASLAGQLGLGAMSEIAGAIFGGLAGAAEYGRGSGPSMGGMAGAPATAESIRNINEGVSGYVGDLYDAGPEAQALGQQIMQGIGETIAPIAEYAMEGDITDEYGINMLPLLAQKLGIPLYELLERVYSMMPELEQEALKSGADAFL